MTEVEDIAIDVPAAYGYMGIFLGHLALLEGTIFTFSSLPELLAPLIGAKSSSAPKVVTKVFATIREARDEKTFVDMYKADPVDLALFWNPERRLDDVVADWVDANDLSGLVPSFKLMKTICGQLGNDSDSLVTWIEVGCDASLYVKHHSKDISYCGNVFRQPLMRR
jgi:hypothetical protein